MKSGRPVAAPGSQRKRALPRPAEVLSSEAMHRHSEEAIALLKGIASHNRLLLLCQLVEGERSVGELAQVLKLSQSVVSQHLALLRRDRIVNGRREAQSIYYRISDERARTLMTTLFELFCMPQD
ncbi:ArsR/SmtB family transcription factor [Rhodanobacter sp. UC4450_H17]|jgi:ArsR family transcriptional regulator, virulence genes transcriptional regulator